jgi:hypothetical protein
MPTRIFSCTNSLHVIPSLEESTMKPYQSHTPKFRVSMSTQHQHHHTYLSPKHTYPRPNQSQKKTCHIQSTSPPPTKCAPTSFKPCIPPPSPGSTSASPPPSPSPSTTTPRPGAGTCLTPRYPPTARENGKPTAPSRIKTAGSMICGSYGSASTGCGLKPRISRCGLLSQGW